MMTLIAGLGNPGLKYKRTRHNAGFLAIDAFRKINKLPRFKMQKKFRAEITESILDDKKIILAKPQTFMNSSGAAIKAIAQFYKLSMENIIIVHDDIAIALGEIKISQNKGTGGHNGIKSIIDNLGSQNFTRVRIGIHPQKTTMSDVERQTIEIKKFVLQKFTKDEKPFIEQAIQKSSTALYQYLTSNVR